MGFTEYPCTPSTDLPHPVHSPSPFNTRHLIASGATLKIFQTTYSLRVMVDRYRGITELVRKLSLIERVHIGARALLDINLIWFGYFARFSHLGGGG